MGVWNENKPLESRVLQLKRYQREERNTKNSANTKDNTQTSGKRF